MVNLVPNGEFETTSDGAINNANATVSRTTAVAHAGFWTMAVQSIAAGDWSMAILELDGVTRIAVDPSTQYTYSAWIFPILAVPYRIEAVEYDSGGSVVATTPSEDGVLPGSTWTERIATFTTDPSTVSVLLVAIGTGAPGGGGSFAVDTVSLELVSAAPSDPTWSSGDPQNYSMNPAGNLRNYGGGS